MRSIAVVIAVRVGGGRGGEEVGVRGRVRVRNSFRGLS